MTAPRVLLQIRNSGRIAMSGDTHSRVRDFSSTSLDMGTPVAPEERTTFHYETGYIPEGKKFVVTRIIYKGISSAVNSGSGRFLLMVRGTTIVDDRDKAGLTSGVWMDRLEILPGQENEVFIETGQSSTGEALLEGAFVDQE